MVGVVTRKLLKVSGHGSLMVCLPRSWVRFVELVNGGRLAAVESYESELGLVVRPARTVPEGDRERSDVGPRPLIKRSETKLWRRNSPRLVRDDQGTFRQVHWLRVYRSGGISSLAELPREWIQRKQFESGKRMYYVTVFDDGPNLVVVPQWLNLPLRERHDHQSA